MNDRFAAAFTVPPTEPAYLAPEVRDTMTDRVARARAGLSACRVCPRHCGIDRSTGETGNCRTGHRARVSSAFAHFGEEDCLRGTRGSGTIFFSQCNLGCVFCQNWDISQQPGGQALDAAALADVMLALQERDCRNINLVTPSHVVPQVVEALALAIDGGLTLPVVYNTGGYDALSSLNLMDGIVDIYMPDFKLWSAEASERLLTARDYPDRAREAVREMHRQVGDLVCTGDGVGVRGRLSRRLVMPDLIDESRASFQFLADEVSRDTFTHITSPERRAPKVGTRAQGEPERRGHN